MSQLSKADKLKLKQDANWRCQSCDRSCRKPAELVSDFIDRIGDEYWAELSKDCEENELSSSTLLGIFVLCVMSIQCGYKVMCAACALKSVRIRQHSSQKQKRLEIEGQLRLF